MIVKDYYGISGCTLDTETMDVSYKGEVIGDYFGAHMMLRLIVDREKRKEVGGD